VLEAMRCMLLCRYAGGCGGYALFMELWEVSKVLEVMRGVLLCLLEVLEVTEVMRSVLLCLPEVMRCVLLCLLNGWRRRR